MAFVREGFQAYTQDYLSRTIANNIYKKCPLFYALVGLGGNQTKSNMRIGRPGVADVFSGKKMSKIQRETLVPGFNAYEPEILFRATSNVKTMGGRDTMPTVASATTLSPDQNIGTAKFGWCRKTEPILVWKTTLDRAMGSGPAGLNNKGKAVANVLEVASDQCVNNLIDAWALAFWTSNPTNQSSDPWDNPAGVQYAIGNATNIYGNVDRSVAANSQWVPQVVSSARAAVLSSIVDEANLTLNCGIYGKGIDLILTTTSLYRTFKDECRSKGQTVLSDGLPEMGEFGFKQEMLKFDNTYVMYDPNCPASTVACFNLETWKLIMDGKKNFSPTEFIDLPKYAEGAKDAYQAYVDSQMILACEAPSVNAYFSNVS